MQIVEKSKEGLSCVYEVAFSQKFINEKVNNRLKEIGGRAKLDGFRTGKVPSEVIKQRYYDKALAEQLKDSVQGSLDEIVKKFKVNYKLKPKISPQYDEKSGNLSVKVEIETLPEVKIPDLSKISVNTYKIKIAADDIKKHLDDLKGHHTNWVDIPKGEVAKTGNLVEFSCRIHSHRKGDKPQKYNDAKAVIGQNTYGPGFDKNICGKKVGDKVQFTTKLPKGHKFAGTKLDYSIVVKGLKSRSEFKNTDDFAKYLGKTTDELRSSISKDIDVYYTDMSWLAVKRQVLDWLCPKCDFLVSKEFVDIEFNNLWRQAEQASKGGSPVPEKEKETLRKEYMGIAERRVKLGFMLSEIGRLNKVSIQPKEMKVAIEKAAVTYGMDSKSMYEYCMSNRNVLEAIRAAVFEDKVINHILSQAKTTEISITPAEVRKLVEDDVSDTK